MEPVAFVTAFLGLIYIVARGPLIFAPTATIGIYRRLFLTPTRIRAFGGFLMLLGVSMVFTAGLAPEGLAHTAKWIGGFGWIVAVAAAAIIVLPGFFRKLVFSFWDAVSDRAIRSIGVISVVFGIFLIAVAFFEL